MARLRIRIELNRGGMGVPLYKLASVVDHAQKFFHMLSEDIHIDHTKGEWLGFDFDHESLNFTAEFVGHVTAEQVSDFNASFDGTTPLRRATIAQFARITDAIEEDELIGFGLYLTDQGSEPNEWRCLSRRDAVRIADEIQVLIEATGEANPESHLPAVVHSSAGARLFSERRERGAEADKLEAFVREVEANLSKRIGRVEHELEDHSGVIHELRSKSTATEDSVRSLLTAVENFCAQTTHQLERMSPPLALPAPQPAAASTAAPISPPKPTLIPALTSTLISAPEPVAASIPTPVAAPVSMPAPTPPASTPPVSRLLSKLISARDPKTGRPRPIAIYAVAALVILCSGILIWNSRSPQPSDPQVAVASSTPEPSAPAEPATPVRPAAPHLDLQASEMTWVSLAEPDGTRILSQLFQPGDSRSVDLPKGATLRVGNAAGLSVRFNGNPIGAIGPHGAVREVRFKDGDYKIVPVQ
jgi:Domain of unknown function (DUF4115)